MMNEMAHLRNNHTEGASLGVAAKRGAALSTQHLGCRTWHFPLSTRHFRGGFTLVELIVSMGVLVGLMTMVGMIFSIATNAASTGTANMSVHRLLRMTREVIESDLENFDPAGGALAIYGWEQLAYALPGAVSRA